MKKVKIECYHCHHIFTMDQRLFEKSISVQRPKCEDWMAKDLGYCKNMVAK